MEVSDFSPTTAEERYQGKGRQAERILYVDA